MPAIFDAVRRKKKETISKENIMNDTEYSTDRLASQADYQSFKNTPEGRLRNWQERYRKLRERCDGH